MFTLVAIPLILFGLGWMAWHYRAYRAVSGRGSKAERGFEARRFLRRMQASAMIAVAGVLLLVGQVIEPDERPAVYVVYWCGVVLWMAWILALAGADAIANARHAKVLHREFLRERARLEAEIARLRRSDPEGEE